MKENRKTGRTTRLADIYIQELFNRGEIYVIDHHPTRQASKYLVDIILRRLEFEHPSVKVQVEKLKFYRVYIVKEQ